MTSKDSAEFDRQLKLRAWTYHPVAGEFRAGSRRLEWEELIGVMPGLTFDDLMAYETRKHNEWAAALSKARES